MSPSSQDWLDLEKVTRKVFEVADWQALGEIYFHEDGVEHWRQRRRPVIELGGQLARRLLRLVPAEGRSLWAGAGVAELPVLLAEVTLAGRTVVAANLLERECRVLNDALAEAAPDVPLRYTAGDVAELADEQSFDHVGCISLFTDPERWPSLSGVSYGRLPPVQLDVERFVAEREQARELAAALCARLAPSGWVTTTAEEVSWFLEQAERLGREVEPVDDLVETAVVGDPVGFLQLR